MAGGAFNLGDVFITFVANVEGMVAGLQEVAAASAKVAAVATKDLEEIGIAGKEAGVGIAEGGVVAEEAAGGFSLLGGSMLKTLAPLIAVLGAYEGLKSIVEGANTATNEWNNAQVQVQNTLKQTNDAIGLTGDQVDKMAESFSKGTPITKGAQLQGQATLLTYQAIGKDIFPQVAKILPDVATAFANVQGRSVATSQDVAQAAKKIGVAMTDPEVGVNALTRAGIKFTAAQQDVIKKLQESGDVAGAQKQLLSDFADMTAGKASASLNTYQGAVANAKKQLDDFTGNGIRFAQTTLEKLGDALLVFGDRVLPGIEATGKKIFEYLAPAFESLWKAVKNLLPTLEQFWKEYLEPIAKVLGAGLVVAIKLVVEALTIFIKALKDTLDWLDKHKKGVMELLKVLAPVVGGILAVVGAFKLFALGMATIGKAIEIFKGIWAGLTALMEINPIILIITAIIVITLLMLTHWQDVKQWFDDFMKWFKTHWEDFLLLFGPLGLIVLEIIKHWSDLKQWFMDFIHDVGGFFHQLWSDIDGVWQGMVKDAESIFDAVVKWFKDLPGNILKAIGDVTKLLFNVGEDIINGLINGIKNVAGKAEQAVKDVANGIKNVAKKILGIFSPSTVFHEIGQNIGQGMANGINSMQDVVSSAAGGMANATLVGANGSFSGSFTGGGYGSGFTVSLDGAQIIGTVPQDVAEKIGDAIVGKLKRTVRI